ncbi:23S rRNA (guanosine(2251)-2'-O)-methyltransferase RlmB [Corynebacterium meridianum]|uniref:23S rRNA (Guanosine(2251)-2'-O)-methyltransferase RlmB n=1 Tax=Corynebacterium meridianum TaxID=2765363 RepID=A0A934I8J9_9CORY|nr:23S rRNA (guanosine(2251)-2'-O)-methyltransferase RlmB [Corynebacterium meridianum]MBI8990362.1 23S rRNA (guanosine(2251)-2'-O)-methyltransferase RlmB [Corynebacterium meridianum]MCK7678615.1 23S rRNA (guanosine(2251)-2'-O)-methyltransferase RlmB [Corynebacterium meridianum]
MAGNSKRTGAVRKTDKKNPQVGSGGQRRRGLRGKGPTPKAEDRTYHPAHKRKKEAERRARGRHVKEETTELVVGRNPVVECLRAKAPANALYVALGTESDERLTEAVQLAGHRGISIIEVPRTDLDHMTGNGMHQGIGLQMPPFRYSAVEDLIEQVNERGEPGLIVCLDNVTDPRNLGAVIRSVAAFGGHGVVIPERRSASVTAVAWRTSAGTAARLPVAKATNLTRTLKQFQKAGYQVVGLDAGGDHTLDTYDGTGPTVVVVGSEGKGISRLVGETCDVTLSVPMADWVESLNASVAAGVVLSEFARQRRAQLK